MAQRPKHQLPFKETAAALTAFLVVLSFVAIGFSIMAAQVLMGVEVKAQESWMSAMLSLASAALGFLIGRNELQPSLSAPSTYTGDVNYTPPSEGGCSENDPCPVCGVPIKDHQHPGPPLP